MRSGLLAWAAIAALFVLLRGVRWDENYEFAQVLTGAIPYPAGHPLPVYLSRALSGQTHLAADAMRLGLGEWALNGLRNWVYLLATLWPAYLFGTAFGRSDFWGCLCAVALLQGWLYEFDGSYPHNPWPTLYSNGHVGAGWALLALFALCQGRWFWAVLLAGWMPAVHVGQALPLGITCLVAGGHALWRGDVRMIRGAGLAAPLVLACWAWLAWRMQGAAPLGALAPPFDTPGDADALYRAYIFQHDPHRRLPAALAVAALPLAALLIAAARSQTARATQGFHALNVVLVYLVSLGAAVLGVGLVHVCLGEATPPWMLLWMPYRLLNHVGPLMLALACGLLARHPGGVWIGAGLLLAAALRPLWEAGLPPEYFRRYLFAGEVFPLLLAGAALGAGAMRARLGLIALALGLSVFHQFGAATLLAGAIAGWRLPPLPSLSTRKATALVLLCLMPLAWGEHAQQKHLERDAMDIAVRDALAQQPPGMMLIGPPETYALQARTAAPVLVEAATASYLSYVPETAPAVNGLYRDLYGAGLDYDARAPWQEVWRERSAQEWRALAQRYNAGAVLSTAEAPLQLPVLAAIGDQTLYAVR